MRSAFRLVLPLVSGCPLAFSPALAAPPPAISGLIGEWSGESTRTPGGEPAARPFADARRYWVDGDAVRGEILVGSGNSLQTVRVAIVPRLGHFLKSITAESGRTDRLVGVPAENGVLWTPLSGDRNRFIERVAGVDEQRRLELLVPEGDPAAPDWRVSETLQPAAGAMTGVVGGGAASPEAVEPLPLPSDAELALIDRVADLLLQRDAARRETAKLAHELGAAWRENEGAAARVKAFDAELAELKAQLSAATVPQESGETRVRIEAAEKEAAEARRWTEELEKSLRGAMAKAEDATARAEALDAELTAANDGMRRDLAARAALTTELEGRAREAGAHAARVAELEATVHELQQKTAAAETAAAEASRAGETVARVAEVERALNAVKAELDAVTAAREQTARELAAATAEKAQLETQVADLSAELASARTRRIETEEQLAAAQSQLAAATQQQHEAASRLAAASDTDARVKELEQELEAAGMLVAQRETELSGVREVRDVDRARIAQLEQQLATAQSGYASAGDTTLRLAEVEHEFLVTREQLVRTATQHAQFQQELRAVTDARTRAEEQLAATARERDATRERLAATEEQLRSAQGGSLPASDVAALLSAAKERDAALARVATLESQIEAWTKDAPPAAEENSARLATLEKELEAVRGHLAATSPAAVSAAEAAQRGGLEAELVTARAEVALAQTRHAELESELALARSAAESAAQLGQQSDADLTAARTRLAELESDLAAQRARVASLERIRPRDVPEVTTDERIIDLENRLAATYAQAQQRQEEIDRLASRVNQLETGAPRSAAGSRFALAPPPVVRASPPPGPDRRGVNGAAGQPAPVQRPREPEQRPRASVASPPAPTRPAAGAEVASANPPAPAVDAPVSFRLSTAPARVASATRLPPTRPADNRVFVIPAVATAGEPALATAVRTLPVNGYRRAGPNSVVIISGRAYKPGEMVDTRRGLRFTRIDGNAIVFTGPVGAEYRFQL